MPQDSVRYWEEEQRYKKQLLHEEKKGSRLFGGLFFVQVGADREGVVGIDSRVAFFDVLHDTFFVDDDVGALGPLKGLVLHVVAFEDAVGAEHFFVHVAEERKLDVDLLGEGGVGRGGIHADAEDFRV